MPHPDVTNTADIELAIQSETIPPLLRKRGEPVFQDSWEAEAYAMGTILVKEGCVSYHHWMELMGEAIRKAQAAGDPDTGESYYFHCCHALEALCFEMGLISPEDYQELLALWAQAIAHTPHGVALSIDHAHLDGSSSSPNHGPHHGHDHSHGATHHGPPDHYWSPIHVTDLRSAR